MTSWFIVWCLAGPEADGTYCKENAQGICNQAADGKFSFDITQLAHLKLKDVCEPRGNGSFLLSPHAIMWVSSELV